MYHLCGSDVEASAAHYALTGLPASEGAVGPAVRTERRRPALYLRHVVDVAGRILRTRGGPLTHTHRASANKIW